MAWRTTATFSARAGRVNSTSGIVRGDCVPANCVANGGGALCERPQDDDGAPGWCPERPAAVGEVIASAPGRDPARAVHDALKAGVLSRKTGVPSRGEPVNVLLSKIGRALPVRARHALPFRVRLRRPCSPPGAPQ